MEGKQCRRSVCTLAGPVGSRGHSLTLFEDYGDRKRGWWSSSRCWTRSPLCVATWARWWMTVIVVWMALRRLRTLVLLIEFSYMFSLLILSFSLSHTHQRVAGIMTYPQFFLKCSHDWVIWEKSYFVFSPTSRQQINQQPTRHRNNYYLLYKQH